MMSPKEKMVAAAARARSTSVDLQDMAKELENIASTLPTAKDEALFKATTLSKPLRYVKSQSTPLPKLSITEKKGELKGFTAESLNITKQSQDNDANAKRVEAMVVMSKVIQCLLWDFDFRFTLLPSHQIEAVFPLAGIQLTPLLDLLSTWDGKELARLVIVDKKGVGKEARRQLVKTHFKFTMTRGLLLADVMGLGKTVESIAASVLRNGIFSIKFGEAESKLPTMIIGPNEAVLNQWEESLIMSGVEKDKIKFFNPKDATTFSVENTFILITRYAITVEVRNILNGVYSVLFPRLDGIIKNCLSSIMVGPQRDLGDMRKTELISQALSENMSKQNLISLRTLIIDEAHMMKNMATYWAIGTGLLSAISLRNLPLSGTPYVHGPQDMATLMMYVDPTKPWSNKTWWRVATCSCPNEETINSVRQWRNNYLVRREKSVLEGELPVKTVSVRNVGYIVHELGVYKEHENAYFDALSAFSKLSQGYEDKRDLVNFLFAQMTCMRMSLIHPLITRGREFTIKFSPSRRNMQEQLSNVSKVCVCCKMGSGVNAIGAADNAAMLVPVPGKFCVAATSPCPHYAHKTCLNLLKSEGNKSCPRCKELQTLSQIDPNLAYKIPHPTYSKNIVVAGEVMGFKSSSKIEEVVAWVKDIPQEDKAIVYSFFEGVLDLLEGVFVENLNIECARFDDDVDSTVQAAELARFKKSPTCRVLLATVQSSGTGLNIDEANHIAFLDRCFDTSVHRQAEDRCHNLRQKKDVEVTYFDGSMLIDEIMNALNNVSSTSDTVVLADGSAVGKKEPTIKYDDLSGVINKMMKAVSHERSEYIKKHPENALVPCQTNLVKMIEEKESVPPVSADSPGNEVSNNSNDSPNTSNSVPGVLTDSSNKGRRVSFVPIVASQKRPSITPIKEAFAPAPVYYPSPYAFNAYPNMTTFQQPVLQQPYLQQHQVFHPPAFQHAVSPSLNYSPYNGYGVPFYLNRPVQVSNQDAIDRTKRARNVSQD